MITSKITKALIQVLQSLLLINPFTRRLFRSEHFIGRTIQNNFSQKLKRRDRGVKQAGFWVLHNTYMPSVLIETGFITNRKKAII